MSIYAVSDLHGMYELYQKISDFLKPEDKVYCLGDCGLGKLLKRSRRIRVLSILKVITKICLLKL